MFHLRLLGGALVQDRGGEAIGLTSRRHPLALLALLAISPAGTLSRGKLVGLLWPDSSEKVARNRLTSCLYQVRKELGEEAVVSLGSDIRFNAEVVACDATRFEEALEREEYYEAVGLYKGLFLDGFWLRGSSEFDQWMDRERDRLQRLFCDALETLAKNAEARGELETAARWWKERAAQDVYDSRVAARLVEALAAAGNRVEAQRVAREHERRLEEEFGMEPDAELRDLANALHAPVRSKRTGRNGQAPRAGVDARAESGNFSVRSIAVLPFENLSGTAAGEPFAIGLHDDLLTELSRISSLTVISRTSVLRYKGRDRPIPEIARELGVGTVLEGGVQNAGGRLRLNVQLIDAHSDTHRWVERYDRTLSMDSIFDIQSELAEKIARALQAELTPTEKKQIKRSPTQNLEAYRLYVQGRRDLDQRTETGMRRAAEHFRQAIAEDPEYALAWVGLADALLLLHDYGCDDADSALPTAEDAVQRALSLAPELGEAHASLALLHSNRRNGHAAVAALERAVELHPGYAEAHNWLSWNSQVLGRRQRALESAERAVELDPLSPESVSNLSCSSLAVGDRERALREARRCRELSPEWTTPQFYEALVLYHLGRYAEAIPILQDLPVEWAGSGPKLTLALAYGGLGEIGRMRELLAEFEAEDDRYALAVTRLALGEMERAFQAFRSVDRWDYWPVLSLYHYYPDVLAPLRADDLYRRMLHDADLSWGAAAAPS